MKKVTILTSNEGHVSIAQAIAQKLSPDFDAKVITYRAKEFDLYLPIYQLFPSLFKVPYKVSENRQVADFAKKLINKKYKERISTIIEADQPDCIISTFLYYDKICAEYGKEHGIPVYNVIANPRTIHPLEACSESTANLVFDELAIKTVEDYGIQRSKIIPMGWFVREQFKPVENKFALRKKLRLLEHPLTFLFTAGSDGSSTIVKILPLFFQVDQPLQIIFVCGNNTSLYKSLRMFIKTFHFANRNSPVRFTVLRFVENMHEYMQAADLIVGKAGPNSLFEAIACHVPFFAITHIAGQEDGNLDIIRENNLGIVEENPLKAIAELKRIVQDPQSLDQLKESVRHMAHYNQESGKKLLDLLDGL